MDDPNQQIPVAPQNQNVNNFFKHPIIAQVIASLIAALASGVFLLIVGYITFNVKVNVFEDRLAGLEVTLSDIDDRVRALEIDAGRGSSNDSNNNNPEGRTDPDAPTGFEVITLNCVIPSSLTEAVITDSWSEISDFEDSSGKTTPMQIQDPVAYDRDTQEEYTIGQLLDQKVLLYYENNGEDVFFYGQFDDEGYYTGECITNIYKDGNLKLITNANYSRGEMLSFIKVFPTTTKAGIDVWALSDRVVEKTYSSGETWYYTRNSTYHQSFESDNVTENDIISAEEFIEKSGVTLEGYYFGNTSDGHFNDDTGNACLVKYFENGTVKTLYVGKIKDGDLEDTTGNAWMIGKKDINQANYSYYKGPFINGKSSEDSKYWINSVTQEWIDEYLQGMTFNCELLWSLPKDQM